MIFMIFVINVPTSMALPLLYEQAVEQASFSTEPLLFEQAAAQASCLERSPGVIECETSCKPIPSDADTLSRIFDLSVQCPEVAQEDAGSNKGPFISYNVPVAFELRACVSEKMWYVRFECRQLADKAVLLEGSTRCDWWRHTSTMVKVTSSTHTRDLPGDAMPGNYPATPAAQSSAKVIGSVHPSQLMSHRLSCDGLEFEDFPSEVMLQEGSHLVNNRPVTISGPLREDVQGLKVADLTGKVYGYTHLSPTCGESCESPIDGKNHTCIDKWKDYLCNDLENALKCDACSERVDGFGPCCLTSNVERGMFRKSEPAIGILQKIQSKSCKFWAEVKREPPLIQPIDMIGKEWVRKFAAEGMQYVFSCLVLPQDVEPSELQYTSPHLHLPAAGQCGVFGQFVLGLLPRSMEELLTIGRVACPRDNEAFVSIQLADITGSSGVTTIGYEFKCATVRFKQF